MRAPDAPTGMAERAGAAVHVHLLVRDADVAHGRHGHDGKGLVDLVETDVASRPADLLQQLLDGSDRCCREPGGCLGDAGNAGNAGERLQLAPLGFAGAHQDEGRRAIRDRAGVGRGDRAALAECGLQLGDLGRICREGLLVASHLRATGPALDGNRHDLLGKGAVLVGRLGALEAFDRECVLRLARELIVLRSVLGKGTHQTPLVEGVLQPVEEHVVLHLGVAEACAAAHLRQQVGRVGHAFHAAGDDDVLAAHMQGVEAHHDRLHARAAHLVDRRARHRHR